MGRILHASCNCGYASEELHEGGGMAGVGRDLAACANCRGIVDIRETTGRRRCPKCRRAVTVINVPEEPGNSLFDHVQPEEPAAALTCPRCGKAKPPVRKHRTVGLGPPDLDDARELFAKARLPFPPIPDKLVPAFRKIGNYVVQKPLYLFVQIGWGRCLHGW